MTNVDDETRRDLDQRNQSGSQDSGSPCAELRENYEELSNADDVHDDVIYWDENAEAKITQHYMVTSLLSASVAEELNEAATERQEFSSEHNDSLTVETFNDSGREYVRQAASGALSEDLDITSHSISTVQENLIIQANFVENSPTGTTPTLSREDTRGAVSKTSRFYSTY
ncbi:MAG: hypothetical protein ACTHZ5_11305 [Micrococcaceae bacterium]